jgi:dGTPase
MINALILDLIDASTQRISAQSLKHIDDVRNAAPLIAFSERMQQDATELKQFLREHLYRHYQVQRMTSKARRCVRDLFNAFITDPLLLPPDYVAPRAANDYEPRQARHIADYIAGMTDRYAMREHRRLFFVDDIC